MPDRSTPDRSAPGRPGPGHPAPGRIVLVTRPETSAATTAMSLAARGVAALACPLTRIERVEPPPEAPPDTEAWVFTSGNAVPGTAPAPGTRAYCVGASTARRARRAGFDAIEAGGDGEALARALRRVPERALFQPRARHVALDLAASLVGTGRRLVDAVAYEAVAVEALPPSAEAALAEGRIGVVGFWSARAGRVFAGFTAGRRPLRAGLTAVTISARAARPLDGLGFGRIAVADRPEGSAMLDALARAAHA